jgi:ankyrin repeat protein
MGSTKELNRLVTSLIAAAEQDNVGLCVELLREGAPIGAEFEGLTALHAAAQAGAVNTVKMLIAAGADVHYSTRNQNSEHGDEALDLAAWRNQHEVCEILLDAGANPVRPMSFGGSPLHLAVLNADLRLIRMILDRGISSSIDVPSAPNSLTPFQLAVHANKLDVIRYIAERGEEDLAQRTSTGKTLIQLAANNTATKTLLRALKVDQGVRLATGGTVPSSNSVCTQTGHEQKVPAGML